ncbi:MAG: response regulator [Chloroflexi bacterium]|nr:response regulator [Chloroflexota bacterium]
MPRTIDILHPLAYGSSVENVLLIEGHQLLRGALREPLAQSGFGNVTEAGDPLEAVEKTACLLPRIIVLETM